ncbi:MAG: flavin reductase [Acutalibacteraceae bacterium]
MSFKEINPNQICNNPFDLIGKDWALVTAGDKEKFNTMTVSWGGVGIMWNKPVAFTFIRPQRYTYEFLENGEYFTMSFFDDSYRDVLSFCGSKSGRDYDKPKETGITAVFDDKAPYFSQAKLVLVCKKLYGQFLNEESAVDKSILSSYKNGDYHKMYISEIEKVLVNED